MSDLKVVPQEPNQETPTFNPNKKYTWSQDTQFSLSGGEFGFLLNSLRAIISTPEAQTILLANKAADIVENLLANSVKEGIVVEIPESSKEL
jgi:hypothetical protein